MDSAVWVGLFGLIGVVMTAGVGLATGLATSRAQSKKTTTETYADLLDQVEKWAEKRLAAEKEDAEREQKRLSDRLGRLEVKYERLQARLDLKDKQLTDAVAHIWTLQALVPGPPPPVPESIAAEVNRR